MLNWFELEFEVCSVTLSTIRSPNSIFLLFLQMLNWFEFQCEVCSVTPSTIHSPNSIF